MTGLCAAAAIGEVEGQVTLHVGDALGGFEVVQGLLQALDVLERGALRRQARRLALQGDARLGELGRCRAATTDGHADLSVDAGCARGADVRATPRVRLDQAQLTKRSEGFANEWAADTEAHGQRAFRGQLLAGTQSPGDDVVGDHLRDATWVGCVQDPPPRLTVAVSYTKGRTGKTSKT